MICTGAGVSVSVRLIMDPVTTISCNSAELFAEDEGACCAPAEPAHNKAAAALAAGKVLMEMEKLIWRRIAVRRICCINPLDGMRSWCCGNASARIQAAQHNQSEGIYSI